MIIKLFVKFLNFFGKFLTMMLKVLKILITKHQKFNVQAVNNNDGVQQSTYEEMVLFSNAIFSIL
jgi:hypothetical protein